MIYIFKNSLGKTIKTTEIEARNILDGTSGNRIKYEYLGCADDTQYIKEMQKISDDAKKKFPVKDYMNESQVLAQRKYADSLSEKLEDDLLKNLKPTMPRAFKVLSFSLTPTDNLKEETNPIFKGMTQ